MTARVYSYEMKVWKRGFRDWLWKVQRADGFFVRAVGNGRTDTRAEAKASALSAIDQYEAEATASWKAVE